MSLAIVNTRLPPNNVNPLHKPTSDMLEALFCAMVNAKEQPAG